jgi:epoxyqueuosine reductase QueG
MALTVFPSPTDTPSPEYYGEYGRVSAELRQASGFLAAQIEKRGFSAYSLAGQRQNEDFTTPLPLKTLATRAGLGWIGKSATLVTPEYGNAIRLGGVLTDMPLAVGGPIGESRCGDCTECAKNCPGNAIMGRNWSPSADRDLLLNAPSCKAAVIKRGGLLGGVTEGSCGVCLAVCPWTKAYISRLHRDRAQ